MQAERKTEKILRKNGAFRVQTVLFASFLFVQFVVLRFANQAGRGYLTDDVQEGVYYVNQVFVILGFLTHALLRRRAKTLCPVCLGSAILLFAGGGAVLFFAPCGSLFYLIATAATVFFLGIVGGAVYLRMAEATESGLRAGLCMAVSYAVAVLLQYVFQLKWSVRPAVGILGLGAFAVLFLLLVFPGPKEGSSGPEKQEKKRSGSPVRKLVFGCVIVLAMLLFTGYYNSYIHHLQISSGYADYNVYTWPRLLMIPGFFLFGFLGDLKKGKFLPLGTLCVVVLGLLNAVLAGKLGTYWLNMCLYYVALSAAISYYNLTFWRISPLSRNPALWAPMGRMLDSLSVLPSLFLKPQDFPAGVVLLLNIVSLSVIIVLMAVNGDLNLGSAPVPDEAKPETADRPSDPRPGLSEEEAFARMQADYKLTPGETKVLKELVCTEDKQVAIAETLHIKLRTVQANVTSIYRKTGVSTRSGLVQLFRDLTN